MIFYCQNLKHLFSKAKSHPKTDSFLFAFDGSEKAFFQNLLKKIWAILNLTALVKLNKEVATILMCRFRLLIDLFLLEMTSEKNLGNIKSYCSCEIKQRKLLRY